MLKMNRILKIGVIDVIVAILVAIALVFSFIPCDRAIFILPLLLLSYLIPVVVYRRSSYYNLWGEIALSVAFVMMTIFFTLNLWQSTVLLGSTDAPLLLHDAYFFHRLSQDIVHQTLSENSPIVPYMGYPYYLSLWLLVGINDIAYPIVVNLFLLLMSLLLVGRCVCFIVGEHSSYASRMAGCAMLLTAIVPGVMVNGTVLLKESFVIVSLLLCINAFYAFSNMFIK